MPTTTRRQPTKTAREFSDYAAENQRRQAEWERGFRQRIEWMITELGGPSAVSNAAHIKLQSLMKIRKGGSRLALFATLVDVTRVNPTWLLLGSHSDPPFRPGLTPGLTRSPRDESTRLEGGFHTPVPRNAKPRSQRTSYGNNRHQKQ